MSRSRRATALRYDGRDAPRVVATGRGQVADRIIEAAAEAGVPLREDPLLMEALATLELDQEIPPELYKAVAEALAWAYQLSGKRPPAPRSPPRRTASRRRSPRRDAPARNEGLGALTPRRCRIETAP